jgi:hypothetical protein
MVKLSTVTVTALVATSLASVAASQESQLRQAAKERDVTLHIMNAYEPATFEMLVQRADTVVVATILKGRTFLAGEQIVTHYDARVDQVIRRTPPGLIRGDVLMVRRVGGAMTMEGHSIVGHENDFPQFTIGDTYVLFLKRVENREFYWVAYGPQGAFHVDADSVRQVSEVFGSWNRERGKVSLRDFIAEVLAVSRQP